MNDVVVKIDGLNFSFKDGSAKKQILFDIQMEIYSGEIIIMTGPSGSGKTTLLTLIGALRSTSEGSVQVFGQELRNAKPAKLVEVRRNIGYIFQSHNLLKFLTAKQNVEMSLQLHRSIKRSEAQKRAVEMLTKVGLSERINYYPENLSVGQKQRIAIARALVSNPKLVLADEPTAALDSKSGRDVVDILQKLAKEQGCPILIVTHDNRILDIADRMLHMDDGRLMNGLP